MSNLSYLSDYQTFQSTQELNNAVAAHISGHHYELSETECDTLIKIARYAVKFSGAAHLKAETIATLIGKSIPTARRAVNKLVSLRIIRKVKTIRKVSGGKGANILQILPFNNDDQSTVITRDNDAKPTDSKAENVENGKEPSISFNQNNNNTYLETAVPSNALKGVIPEPIYEAMSRYFNADNMYNYYGILLRAKASIDRNILIEDDPEPFVEAWDATILKAKHGKIRNMSNYLFASWQAATAIVARRKASKQFDEMISAY